MSHTELKTEMYSGGKRNKKNISKISGKLKGENIT